MTNDGLLPHYQRTFISLKNANKDDFCRSWCRFFVISLSFYKTTMLNLNIRFSAQTLQKTYLFIFAFIVAITSVACGGKKETSNKNVAATKKSLSVDTLLRQRLSKFASARRPQGNFGLYVYDLNADKLVFADHENLSQPIASNTKLLSGVAALHKLGTRYKYTTSLYTRGDIKGDLLHGDVIFKASLDPLLLPEDLTMFAKALRRKGITKFDGRLIFDLILHEKVKAEEHWYPWDLAFSHYGLLYKGEDKVQKALKQAFKAQGIAVADSQLASAQTPRSAHCIFRFYRSIDRVTRRMWKNSSNTQATSLLYTLGHAVQPSNPDLATAGTNYLREFLRTDLGQRDTSLVIHDGCGLCTQNRLSPKALGAILIYGYQHKDIYKQLMENLSISGVDGTLYNLVSDPRTRGRIHGKTGTLSHPYGISSLAGYCRGADGHELAFVLLNSEMSVLDAHVLQRNLCKALIGN